MPRVTIRQLVGKGKPATAAHAWIQNKARKRRPMFVEGIVTELVDATHVTVLSAHLASGSPISLPVDYSPCDAQAFQVGDAALVFLANCDQARATVIGFARDARQCVGGVFAMDFIEGVSLELLRSNDNPMQLFPPLLSLSTVGSVQSISTLEVNDYLRGVTTTLRTSDYSTPCQSVMYPSGPVTPVVTGVPGDILGTFDEVAFVTLKLAQNTAAAGATAPITHQSDDLLPVTNGGPDWGLPHAYPDDADGLAALYPGMLDINIDFVCSGADFVPHPSGVTQASFAFSTDTADLTDSGGVVYATDKQIEAMPSQPGRLPEANTAHPGSSQYLIEGTTDPETDTTNAITLVDPTAGTQVAVHKLSRLVTYTKMTVTPTHISVYGNDSVACFICNPTWTVQGVIPTGLVQEVLYGPPSPYFTDNGGAYSFTVFYRETSITLREVEADSGKDWTSLDHTSVNDSILFKLPTTAAEIVDDFVLGVVRAGVFSEVDRTRAAILTTSNLGDEVRLYDYRNWPMVLDQNPATNEGTGVTDSTGREGNFPVVNSSVVVTGDVQFDYTYDPFVDRLTGYEDPFGVPGAPEVYSDLPLACPYKRNAPTIPLTVHPDAETLSYIRNFAPGSSTQILEGPNIGKLVMHRTRLKVEQLLDESAGPGDPGLRRMIVAAADDLVLLDPLNKTVTPIILGDLGPHPGDDYAWNWLRYPAVSKDGTKIMVTASGVFSIPGSSFYSGPTYWAGLYAVDLTADIVELLSSVELRWPATAPASVFPVTGFEHVDSAGTGELSDLPATWDETVTAYHLANQPKSFADSERWAVITAHGLLWKRFPSPTFSAVDSAFGTAAAKVRWRAFDTFQE